MTIQSKIVNGSRWVVLYALLACTLLACGEAFVDPYENDDKYYSVFGYIDLLERDHAVRVVPLTRSSAVVNTPTSAGSLIDAEVYTIDQVTQSLFPWKHDLEELDDGTYAHVFRANFVVQPGRRYKLYVVRSDSAMSTAETRVPYIGQAVLYERGEVSFEQDSIPLQQTITIPDVPSPWKLQSVYQWFGGGLNRRVYVEYGRSGERTEDGGWRITVNIKEDQAFVREDIARIRASGRINETTPVTLGAMGVQFRILDENWNPPEGVFEIEDLIQPGTLSNVENGYGFFGSVGLYIQEWNVCEFSGPLGYTHAEHGC